MNPMDLLKNFQNIQSKVAEAQERLQSIRATGSAGGDMVRIEITGEFTVIDVRIAPAVVDPFKFFFLILYVEEIVMNTISS